MEFLVPLHCKSWQSQQRQQCSFVRRFFATQVWRLCIYVSEFYAIFWSGFVLSAGSGLLRSTTKTPSREGVLSLGRLHV